MAKAKKKKKQEEVILPKRLVTAIADEVAKIVVNRLPARKKSNGSKKMKELNKAVFLDTSAIIDGRIFDVLELGLLVGPIVVPESILLELKHIADSQDTVKRERGRKGLERLERVKKVNGIKLLVLSQSPEHKDKKMEVDEVLIAVAKNNKGRIITCDYNLEKKATIQGVTAVNVNALAHSLKVLAVPGEALHVKVLHKGKDATQGVGYLDDGTMIVIENGSMDIGKTIDAVVSRVIQTAAGRILFAKKI